MITGLLRQEGWHVNVKRVERLWRLHGRQRPTKRRKRRRLGCSENGSTRLQAAYPNHVWSYDFLMDATEGDARLKLMPVVDEYTREGLAISVERSITAEDVVETLSKLFAERGTAYVHSIR